MPIYEVAHVHEPEHAFLDHIHFRSGGAEGRPVTKNCRAEQYTYVCNTTYEFPAPVDMVDAECTLASITVPNHVHILHAYKGEKSDQAVFDLSSTKAEIWFRPPTAFETGVRAGGAGFMRAAGGLAPLLFIAALVLAARTRQELILSAIAFIVAEAAACAFAPRMSVRFSPQFIEAAAALTIAYLAFEIIMLPKSGKRWLIVGVLGVFHGLYFSIFLKDSGDRLAPFLMGVVLAELLLIAVLAAAVYVLVRVTRTARAIPVTASLLLAVGVTWFVIRLGG